MKDCVARGCVVVVVVVVVVVFVVVSILFTRHFEDPRVIIFSSVALHDGVHLFQSVRQLVFPRKLVFFQRLQQRVRIFGRVGIQFLKRCGQVEIGGVIPRFLRQHRRHILIRK